MRPKALSLFHAILVTFQEALTVLAQPPSAIRLERLSTLVYEGMAAKTRYFHSVQHGMDVAGDEDPIEMLAGLYHDVVYYQVDQGLAPQIQALLDPYFVTVNGAFHLREPALRADPLVTLVYTVFGRDPAAPLPTQGQNEFLSAFIAAAELADLLEAAQLTAVLACIEGTIPFRAADCFVRLAERLAATPLAAAGPDAICQAVQRAVRIANRDVANFSDPQPGRFLDNTWELIPESNPSLQNAALYTIRDYRIALEKMEGFLHRLAPAAVFHAYAGQPDASTLASLQQRTRHNLAVAVGYLHVKLYTIALIEALAEATGGDAPLLYFMGDLRYQGADAVRIEDFLLPPPGLATATDLEPTVQALLEQGRTEESSYDMKTSPISAYLYCFLGTSGIAAGLVQARRLFGGELSAPAFLATQNSALTAALAQACALTAVTRARKLHELFTNTSCT